LANFQPLKCQESRGGFRDTYLGRQVVSRSGGPRAGMGSAGGMEERCERL